MITFVQVLLWLALLCFWQTEGACPCKDSKLCQPIGTPKGLEFVGFTRNQDIPTVRLYDWKKLTTAVITEVGPQTNEFLCYAHARNVRVTLLVAVPTSVLENESKRTSYVMQTVSNIVHYNLDGVNMDFEGNIGINSPAYNVLTTVMQELRSSLRSLNNVNYTLSMNYVFCPACISGRTYNYEVIQHYIDYFILMDYDMQGKMNVQSLKTCSVLVNSPIWAISRMTNDFLKQGVPSSKLVMAFPWYGYIDSCEKFDVVNQICYPDCKHTGASQLCYRDIMNAARQLSTDGRQWNLKSLTPFFSFIKDGTRYQVNYDDPWSLRNKYELAKMLKVRGVGIWTIDCLDYSNSTQAIADRQLMWETIPTGH